MQRNHTPDSVKSENPLLVYNRKGFAAMMTYLSKQSIIALDTESDSLFRYYPKVCLIQITALATTPGTAATTPGPTKTVIAQPVVDYLVDPLRCDELQTLELVFADPAIEKVMHAAENDMLTLQRAYGFDFHNIFDTQLAARILGWKRLGLAALLEEHFGVVSNKRMQRTNWGQRPLTPQQIAYAQMDTHYLLALRDKQVAELHEKKRWQEAQEAFGQLSQIRLEDRPEPTRNFWQVKGIRDLPRTHWSVLAALWQWRENEAQRLDRPPFKVMNEDLLLRLAQQQPGDREALRAVNGMSGLQVQRYGDAILQTIAAGAKQPPPTPPPVARAAPQMDALTARRFEALRQWRTKVANARQVAPDIILTNDRLLEIAQRAPQTEAELMQIDAIGPWKARTYGPEIFAVLRRTR